VTFGRGANGADDSNLKFSKIAFSSSVRQLLGSWTWDSVGGDSWDTFIPLKEMFGLTLQTHQAPYKGKEAYAFLMPKLLQS
jgi:hypothetical protein